MSLDTKHALVNLEEIRIYRDISDKHVNLIEFLINSRSLAFEKKCRGRIFIEATYSTLYLDGTGNRMLFIPHYPITSIETVTEDDVDLTKDEDYVIYGDEGEGYLWKVNGVWSEGAKNIKLTSLKAGYTFTSVPGDLKDACITMVLKEFEKALNKAGAEETRDFPDASITWNFKEDEAVINTLSRYTRLSL